MVVSKIQSKRPLSTLQNCNFTTKKRYHVLTSDGYILGIHRVPGPKGEGPVEVSKPIALLAHGLLASSSQWIFGPAYNSMGYALADEGVHILVLKYPFCIVQMPKFT